MNRNQQIARLPDTSELLPAIARGMGSFARRHKFLAGSYVFGLLFLTMVGSGIKLTYEQQRQYNHILDTIDLQAEYDASQRYWQAQQAYYATKGWFWSCDALCQRNKQRMEAAQRDLDMVRAESAARVSDAKAVAGLFSEVGVSEVKDSFWQYFSAGKQFAKRQTMWDALFVGLRSLGTRGREESMAEYVVRIVLHLLINFSMGLIMALVVFVIGLWSIVRSYQPNPIVAVVFFCGAACAAYAFVMTYLMALFGAVGGGIYGMAKLAESNANARIGQGQARRPVYNRPHYD